MVFKSKRGRVTDWCEVAVSYAEDPNEALEEVLHDMGAEDCDICPEGGLSANSMRLKRRTK